MNFKYFILCLTVALFSQQTINAQKSTTELLEAASKQASNENKSILIKFEASWCGWCKRMTANLEAENTKQLFIDNYVIVPLVVKESKDKKHLENEGSDDFLKKYKGENSGLPFWLILDSDLKLIANSLNAKGENLGCPATKDEVAEFIKKLKMSSSLNDEELTIIANQFIIKK